MAGKLFLALIVLLSAIDSFAASVPSTVAQIALYQGADREKILVAGAKREGQVTFYNSHTWFRTFVKDFEKKYPFIKVAEWRNDSKNLLQRVTDEAKANRSLVDVVETTPEAMGILKRDGLLQEYYSPEARFFPDDVKSKGKSGFHYIGDRETYIGLGFNTNLIAQAEAPKTLRDLLNPKWKGKMSLVTSSSGTRWIGNALDVMGREFVEKLAEQDVRLQDMSGAALSGLVVTGEVPLSPTIFDANVSVHKQKGAAHRLAPTGTGGHQRRLLEPIDQIAQSPWRHAAARLHSFQRRPAGDYEGRSVVAARRYWHGGTTLQKELSRREIFHRGVGN